jgi:hypothetical protein
MGSVGGVGQGEETVVIGGYVDRTPVLLEREVDGITIPYGTAGTTTGVLGDESVMSSVVKGNIDSPRIAAALPGGVSSPMKPWESGGIRNQIMEFGDR